MCNFNECVITGIIVLECILREFIECLLLYLLLMVFDFDLLGIF